MTFDPGDTSMLMLKNVKIIVVTSSVCVSTSDFFFIFSSSLYHKFFVCFSFALLSS